MCDTCGCEQDGNQTIYTVPGKENKHSHDHSHEHYHGDAKHSHTHTHEHNHENEGHHHDALHDNGLPHVHAHTKSINIEVDVLGRNNLLAERNRGYFEAKNIKVFNLMSSPGSGKTTLLEKTIKMLDGIMEVAVIEGDQQTTNDAERIKNSGAPVIQVNTGNGCHLDAKMINRAYKELEPNNDSILFIENVGNLVCPSLFDLGESFRVVIISTTEGEDKPIKYPTMFANAQLCIINKTDLLPHVDFNVEKCKNYALQVNHHLQFINLSAKTDEGMEGWIDWIKNI